MASIWWILTLFPAAFGLEATTISEGFVVNDDYTITTNRDITTYKGTIPSEPSEKSSSSVKFVDNVYYENNKPLPKEQLQESDTRRAQLYYSPNFDDFNLDGPFSPDRDGWVSQDYDPIEYSRRWHRTNARRMKNMTRVKDITAECQEDFMRVRIHFNGTFRGLIYSTGYVYSVDCMYVNGTGRYTYDFYIHLNRCGTLGGNGRDKIIRDGKEISRNYMWNTITVQYDPLIEEEWDEHFKMTCEYGYDIWKTVTFPIVDVNVATGNPVVFTLSPPECYMELRHGFGLKGSRIATAVRVGDPISLIIHMKSSYDGFDLLVSNCVAHNGGTKRIYLIDKSGCPVDEKLISPFQGVWSDTGVFETKVYAFLKAFRFTGSPALYLECDVRMCHGYCPVQPCNWRNNKNRSKRETTEMDSKDEQKYSETLSLFQSIEVRTDEIDTAAEEQKDDGQSDDQYVCLKPTYIAATCGVFGLTILLVMMAMCVFCTRMRKMKQKEAMFEECS